MMEFILSFIIIALCILGLSLSLIFGRGAIKGSCGATENLSGFDAEDGCSGACGSKAGDQPGCSQHHHCRHQQTGDQGQNEST